MYVIVKFKVNICTNKFFHYSNWQNNAICTEFKLYLMSTFYKPTIDIYFGLLIYSIISEKNVINSLDF